MIKNLFLKNTSTGQTILKNTFWLLVSEIVTKGLLFLLMIWIARYLKAEGFGQFSFAFAFVALFAILADFGLSTLTVREVARNQSEAGKYIGNIAVIKLILGATTFILIITTVQFFGKNPEVEMLVYLAGFFTIIQSFTQFFYAIFRAFEKMEYQALGKIIYSLSLIAIAGVALWNNWGITTLLFSYVIAAGIALIATIILIWVKFVKFSLRLELSFWRRVLTNAWPFALSAIFIAVYYYLDSVMLSVMKGDEAVGWYNAAYKPILFIVFLGGTFLNSTLPIISKFYKTSTGKLKRFLSLFNKFMISIAVPLGFGGTILATGVINLFYGPEYLPSVLAFQILIWTAAIIYISVVFCNTLQGCDRQKKYLLGTGVGAVINIILNIILIPPYSLYGAAIATLLAELSVFCFIYWQVNKFISTKILSYLARPLLSAIIMFSGLYFIGDINLLLAIILGVIIYVIFMIITRGFSKAEFLHIKNILVENKLDRS